MRKAAESKNNNEEKMQDQKHEICDQFYTKKTINEI